MTSRLTFPLTCNSFSKVIIGPETEDGPSYFSLNNRRLWVLKRCRDEGLLEHNLIQVRVRKPKSNAELARYSIENCALEAKIMKEDTRQNLQIAKDKDSNDDVKPNASEMHIVDPPPVEILRDEENELSDSDDESSISGIDGSNPFSALA